MTYPQHRHFSRVGNFTREGNRARIRRNPVKIYETIPPETRNKQCSAYAEKAAYGHRHVQRRRPVTHEESALMHILLDKEKEQFPGQQGSRDVHRKVRV